MFILDEAHILRKYNSFAVGALELRHRSFFVLAMTATPVMTSPQVSASPTFTSLMIHTCSCIKLQDICNIGRFLGIKYFEDNLEKLDKLRRALAAAARRERASRKEGGGEVKLARAVVKGKMTQDVDSGKYRESLLQWMAAIREGFQGAVVRRTINSVDWRGNPISGLDKYREHILALKLSPREQECQEQLAIAIQSDGVAYGGKKLEVCLAPW